MNIYILIARHIGKVSGEKIYSFNKLRYMVSLGWRVLFLSGKKEETPVDGVPNFSQHTFPSLTYTPFCYSKREVKKTIESIAAIIGETEKDLCVIESDSVNRAVWGELIAKRVHAKHVAFLLQEKHHYPDNTRAFLRFKYGRHELAGITAGSINQILGDEDVERRDDTKIAALCNNTVEDCEDTFSDRLPRDAKYTFGSLGRLDKSCVPAILEGFMAYAAAHPEDKFNLILIGGSTGKKRIQHIQESMSACRNIHMVITGYIYPIPAALIKRIDLFVSTAGSASVTYRYHRPTIKVHPDTGAPSAIMGLEGMETKSMYDVLPGITIEECIEKALLNRDRLRYDFHYYEDYQQRMNAEFDRHLEIAAITKTKEYYDETSLMQIKPTHIKGQKFHWAVGHAIGAKGLNRVVEFLKTVKKV